MMRPQVLAMPPAAPTVTYTRTQNGSGRNATATVNAAWLDTTVNETAWVVQWNSGSGWVDAATVTSTTTDTASTALLPLPKSATVSGLSPTTTYRFRVLAQNTVGLGGQFPSMTAQSASAETQVGPTAVALPAAPTSLAGTALAGPQVSLTFTDNATNETGFVIERCTVVAPNTSCTNFAQIAQAPARTATGSGTVTYLDATVTVATGYVYRVAAVNAAGMSSYATPGPVLVNVPAAPPAPAAPTSFTALAVSQGNQRRANLAWTVGNTANLTGFTIQRATDSGFTANVVSTPITIPTQTTLTVTGLARNTFYYFRIKANNLTTGGSSSSPWLNASPFPIKTAQ